jgi:hypothetical protein
MGKKLLGVDDAILGVESMGWVESGKGLKRKGVGHYSL